jgi:hypothetical protein
MSAAEESVILTADQVLTLAPDKAAGDDQDQVGLAPVRGEVHLVAG